jgi:hypothetical protein
MIQGERLDGLIKKLGDMVIKSSNDDFVVIGDMNKENNVLKN